MRKKIVYIVFVLTVGSLFFAAKTREAQAAFKIFDYELFKKQIQQLQEFIVGKEFSTPRDSAASTTVVLPQVATTTVVEQKLASPAQIFMRTLRRGMRGEDIRELQLFLEQFSGIYPEGITTGYFGPLTEAAVKRFQETNGIEQVGVVGPKTRTRLNELTVSRGVAIPQAVPGDVSSPVVVSQTISPSDALPHAAPPPSLFSFPLAMPSDKLRTAAVLDIPLPRNIHCVSDRYLFLNNEPECYAAYHPKFCRSYANPVSDEAGVTYPSACWADELGAQSFNYGYSERMTQFASDLWRTPRDWDEGYKSFEIPKPHIDFSFGSDLNERKLVRSTTWSDFKTEMIIDYFYDFKKQRHFTSFGIVQTLRPVYGERKNLLLAMVLFDEVYSEKMLLEEARSYENDLNDYLRKKQNVPNPVQFDITPVVIPPPPGMSKPPANHLYYVFHPDDVSKIYNAAVAKAEKGNFHIVAVAPVVKSGPTLNYGGAVSTRWNNLDLISFFVSSPVYYSEADIHQGLQSLSALRVSGLGHELLHVLGWSGDHDPYQERSFSINLQTGGELTEGKNACDYMGESALYATELPPNLAIRVGSEPGWAATEQSATGPCMYAREGGPISYLKDYDKDGVYERVASEYNFYPMDLVRGLARSLGWVDIDGDGIGEVADTNPYGGFKEIMVPARSGATLTEPLIFELLEDVEFHGCRFKRIRLENGERGLLPVQCKEFNEEIVNVYKNLEYRWLKVPKDYGMVLLPRLPGRKGTGGITLFVVAPEERCKPQYGAPDAFTIEQALSDKNTCRLFLSQKNLQAFPAEPEKISHLSQIFLQNNQIASLPETIGNLSNLEKLHISQNKLIVLPESVGNLSRLRELDLNGNNLSTIPPSISRLTNLRILDLSQNKLTELPPEIGDLQGLTAIKLDQNPLKRIPSDIGNLKNLREISVWSGYGTEVPAEIFELRSLNTLTLSGAVLKAPISLVSNLRELRELTLGGLGLFEIPKEIFSLNKLVSLKLHQNYITEVQKEIVKLTKLRHLYLADNQISRIPDEITRLTNLKSLVLSRNPISKNEIERLKKLLPSTTISFELEEPAKISIVISSLPSTISATEGMKIFWGGGAGVYSHSIQFTHDDSLFSRVKSFRIYSKKPGDQTFAPVAEFADPSGIGPCKTGSLRSGGWTLLYLCEQKLWWAISGHQKSFSYTAGEYDFYTTVLDNEGRESAPSEIKKYRVLQPTKILSPTFSQSPVSQTPEFRWTIADGWPATAKNVPYYITVSHGTSTAYSTTVYVDPSVTREGVKKYDGPPLDPSKKYLLHIQSWSPDIEGYISMNEAPTAFWVGATQ